MQRVDRTMTHEAQRGGEGYEGTIFMETHEIHLRQGKQPLTNDDILVLACAEIYKTYTREEKAYS